MKISKKVEPVIRLLLIGYVFFICTWFGVWWFLGDALWWMVVLTYFQLELFFPAPVVIVLAWLSRRPVLIGLSWLPPFIFLGLFWPYFVPRPVVTTAQPDIRVMTFNVSYSNEAYEAVAGVVKTYHPDLIALQEVQPEMMVALVERLDALYPYHLRGGEHPYGTTAVFSRHPFLETLVLDLDVERPAVVTRLLIGDQPVTFIAVHLLSYGLQWYSLDQIPEAIELKTAAQNRQVEHLLALIREQPGLVIVGCDCNSREHLSSSAMFDRVMMNAAREVGWRLGANVPTGLVPDRYLYHIDYVFYQGDLEAVGIYRAQTTAGSDHHLVVADFVLPN